MAPSTLLRPASDVMRILFLYVGQGDSTLCLIPDGLGGHRSLLVDCNRAPALGGIDLPLLLQDLPTREDGRPRLDVFGNTHPHNDHLCGISEIEAAVLLKEVWHSGHRPSSAHAGPYSDLQSVIQKVRARGGQIVELLGSRTPKSLGLASIHVVAPAQHVCDDIAGETAEVRDRRIHEHCAVLRVRFSGGSGGVLLTGDSDRTAWREHITDYHGQDANNRIAAWVMSASHHGSRTFFKATSDDPDVYADHLSRIDPSYVVISAPDQADSCHAHPHEDAVALYADHVGSSNVLHMGSRRWSFVLDVFPDGTHIVYEDRGELADAYGLASDVDNTTSGGSRGRAPAIIIPRIEQSREMGGA